jgi:hypothetical protein
MLLRHSVTCEGAEYVLVYRLSSHASTGWAWVDAIRRNPAAPDHVERLRDTFLSQEVSVHGRPTCLVELRRLYEILKAMGARPEKILQRFGVHEPRKCRDCRMLTIDGYSGPRCATCHEHFVRTARQRNAGLSDVTGGRMSGGRRG